MKAIKFVNRISELNHIATFLNKEFESLCFIEAIEASGITTFLKKITNDYKNIFFSLYIDVNQNQSLSSLLFNKIQNIDNIVDIQNIVTRYTTTIPYEKILLKIADAVSMGITSGFRNDSLHLYTGSNSSLYEDLLNPILIDLAENKRILLVIDSAQHLSDTCYETIKKLMTITDIKIILALTDNNNNRGIKLKNYFTKTPSIKSKLIEFGLPNANMIQLLLENQELSFTLEDVAFIEHCTRNNIHKIITYILDKSMNVVFTDIEISILTILKICNSKISKDDLLIILKKTHEVYSNINFINSIKSLNSLNMTSKDKDDNILLNVANFPSVEEKLNNYTEKILYTDRILQTLQRKKNLTEHECELTYSLAKEYSIESYRHYAKQLLFFKLKNGEEITEVLLHDAKLQIDIDLDAKLAAVIYCKQKDYRNSFMCLNGLNNPSSSFKGLKAIVLNRLRYHKDAKIALNECIQNETDASKRNIILAYYISNCMHNNEMSLTREIWDNHFENQYGTKYFGYFARNMLSTRSEQADFYELAIEAFQEENDEFGEYTTKCNYAGIISKTDANTASDILNECIKPLQRISSKHLDILYNNIGLVQIWNRNYASAVQNFDTTIFLTTNSMPKLFAQINKSFALILDNQESYALNLMRQIENEVNNHPVDRIAQLYYSNRVLVELCCDNYEVTSILTRMNQHLDRHDANITKKRIEYYKRQIYNKKFDRNTIIDLWSPCTLAYWIIDPLKLVTEW